MTKRELHEETVGQVVRVVLEPAGNPRARDRQLRRMAMEWPELARALGVLCDEVAGARPMAWRGLQR
jgi:hypothetical protein